MGTRGSGKEDRGSKLCTIVGPGVLALLWDWSMVLLERTFGYIALV